VNAQQVRDALPIAVGDSVIPQTLDDVERRLKTIPGVTDARLNVTSDTAGRKMWIARPGRFVGSCPCTRV
jgi:metal-sulfur cluster biosynthetic enzyme